MTSPLRWAEPIDYSDQDGFRKELALTFAVLVPSYRVNAHLTRLPTTLCIISHLRYALDSSLNKRSDKISD